MIVLGIETSCDETAASVVRSGRDILSNVVHSQVEIHGQYGGVVPELASRSHLERILPVVGEALRCANFTLGELDGIAATLGPGLVGSLLVGLQTGKTIAYCQGLPFVGVHHVEGHITAILMRGEHSRPRFPYTALAASGGHTALYQVEAVGRYQQLGTTLDDAAGEAYDKVGKMLGIPYPGGAVIDRLACRGDPDAIRFPRALLPDRPFHFSFSGLKTAVRYHLEREGVPQADSQELFDLAASFQEAVVDVLVDKTIAAACQCSCADVVVSGGVAANSRLRSRMAQAGEASGIRVHLTPLELCTDNAAMIAGLGHHYLRGGTPPDWLTMNAVAALPLGEP